MPHLYCGGSFFSRLLSPISCLLFLTYAKRFLVKWCLLLNLKTHSFSSQVNSIGQNLSRLGNFFLGRKFTDTNAQRPFHDFRG